MVNSHSFEPANTSICIVTPDLIGPIKNGGIGTHAHNLAVHLAKAGFKVDVLFTGPFDHGSPDVVAKYYEEKGIGFLSLNDCPSPAFTLRLDPTLQSSWQAYHFLRDKTYDFIHFQEWQANGFFSVQAKRTLGEFAKTELAIAMHSSTEWIAEGSNKPFERPVEDQLVAWCERYAVQYCDHVVSPSRYMLEWATVKGWVLPQAQSILPYCMVAAATNKTDGHLSDGPVTLAFFGRLETRKGLQPFLSALGMLDDAQKAKIKKVFFLGKIGVLNGQNAGSIIRSCMKEIGLSYEMHTELDVDAAHSILIEQHAVAFAPSLQDNLPLTILECVSKHIPIMASNVGGIPEILSEGQLFEPNAKSIASAIGRLLKGDVQFIDPIYDPNAAVENWIAFHQRPKQQRGTNAPVSSLVSIADKFEFSAEEKPLISVCVPHYNYGRYITQMLDSLVAQSFQNFEVIVLDDGSTDPASQEIFAGLAGRYPAPQYRFFTQENGGIGNARNKAASMAQGPYLVFVDADNVAKPDMLETFVKAIETSGTDVVTCHFDIFNLETAPDKDHNPSARYIPLGQCLDVAWYDNVMGDANMIMRRSAFEAINGFTTDRDRSWEDLELLVRLAFAGFHQETVPRALFWYRNQDEGFSRNTNHFKNQERILRVYLENADPRMRAAIKSMALSSLYGRGFKQLLKRAIVNHLRQRHKLFAVLRKSNFLRWIFKAL